MSKFARVIVDIKNDFLSEGLDYIIPNELEEFVGIGSRVLVPFRKQEVLGYVIEIKDTSFYENEAKSIIEVYDYEQELTPSQIELAKYIEETYLVSMYSVLELMIPSFLKGNKRNYLVIKNYDLLPSDLALLFQGKKKVLIDENIRKSFNLIKKEIEKGNITLDYDLYTYGKGKKQREYYIDDNNITSFKSEKRKIIYDYVRNNPNVSEDNIITYLDCTYYLLREMCKDQTLKFHEVPVIDDEERILENKSSYKFSYDDNQTLNRFFSSQKKKFLLHSNREDFKINFYIKVIEECKKNNLAVLITAPTIMLEEEILMYLKRYLKGYKLYGMSSKNTKKERYEIFMNAKYDNIDCLVTTHSGIFMPFNKLGCIIVVDEENPNYINENYPYYNGIDVLNKMASIYDSSLILTSISPSIDTYYKATNGEYSIITSNDNVSSFNKDVIDMKEEILNGSSSNISTYLKEEISKELKLNHQVMLLVSSKAYLGMMKCRKCGKVLKCPSCGVSLTYSKSKNAAVCNYCGYKLEKHVCPNCSSSDIIGLSYGEEKISEEVREMFPGSKVLDVNADLMTKTDDYSKALNDIEENNVNIIIGTNILSKRIKSDNIKLVAIINADMYLNSNSHKANEQTFNLITKLNNKEHVVIQTFHKDSRIIKLACLDDYDSYYEEEIQNRKLMNYDPFMEINRIIITGDYNARYHAANYIKKFYTSIIKKDILGPTHDLKTQGAKLIVKHNDYDKLKIILKETKQKFKNEKIQIIYERCPKVI